VSAQVAGNVEASVNGDGVACCGARFDSNVTAKSMFQPANPSPAAHQSWLLIRPSNQALVGSTSTPPPQRHSLHITAQRHPSTPLQSYGNPDKKLTDPRSVFVRCCCCCMLKQQGFLGARSKTSVDLSNLSSEQPKQSG